MQRRHRSTHEEIHKDTQMNTNSVTTTLTIYDKLYNNLFQRVNFRTKCIDLSYRATNTHTGQGPNLTLEGL